MKIETKSNGKSAIFKVVGEMRGRDFADLLDKLRSSAYKKLIVDLHQLRFIDSQGIGGLIYSHKILSMAGKELILASPQHYIKRIISDYALDRVLKIINLSPAYS